MSPTNRSSRKNTQRKQKPNKKNTKMPKIFKVVSIIMIFILIAGVGIGGGTLFGYIKNSVELNLDNFKLNFTSFVYYIDDETNQPVEMERLYSEENRVWVNIDKIPKHVQNAFVAFEDQRFWKHPGFDIKRTIQATINYILKGDSSYGASTIPQQLIKNLTGDDEVSPRRKVQEIWGAIQLSKKYSKEQILEYYLNTIFLSQGCNGVQSAANTYFGKDVNELSLAESASIAGITQYPTYYDPFQNPENNKKKQIIILDKMLELGYINNAEYEQAINEELHFAKGIKQERASKQSYFVDQVIADVVKDLVEQKNYSEQLAYKLLYTGGLKIYSTIDPDIQNAMDNVFQDEEFFKSANFPTFRSDTQPEASMLIMDPYTGEIKGIVGGKGEKTGNRTLNRATQTLRQPGSSIKPIGVYAPGFEYGYITSGTVIDDVPVTYGNWSPRNYGGDYRGLTTVRKGIELSRNIVAVKVLDMIGIDTSFDFLENLGISTLVENEKRADGKVYTDKLYTSLALGGLTDGVSVMEMTAAYSPFANRGIYTRPNTYTKVLDHEGNVILEKERSSHIAMSEVTSFLMTKNLEGVVTQGTATSARLSNNMPAAGKTGTTSNFVDKWFIGYTPYYVGGVWYGFDKPTDMTRISNLYYKPNPSAVIWGAVMNEIHKNKTVKQFTEPSGIVKVAICQDSGMLPNEYCAQDPRGSRVYTEYFKKGTEPTEKCTVHVLEKVDKTNNLLANDYCPSHLVEERIFIKRPVPYVPVQNSNGNLILPTDAQYELPAGEYCNEHGPLLDINLDKIRGTIRDNLEDIDEEINIMMEDYLPNADRNND